MNPYWASMKTMVANVWRTFWFTSWDCLRCCLPETGKYEFALQNTLWSALLKYNQLSLDV